MADQLFYLFNDLLLFCSPAFDITGSIELSKLTCQPNQLPTMTNTLSLGARGRPYQAGMVFLCKDREEHDQWMRYLEAAMRTASEVQAHPGVRLIPSSHGRSASSISPSPTPITASPARPSSATPSAHAAAGGAAPTVAAASNPRESPLAPPLPPATHRHANSHELEF